MPTDAARIRVVIVDDEPLAREGLRLLLARDPEVELVGEAAGGRAAVAAIRRLAPDLVFLDVQMPELSGFEVLAQLPHDAMPAVVFVTAYDRYALRAFEVHALDYLLKPFDDERFFDALRRAKRQLRLSSLSPNLLSLLEGRSEVRGGVGRLAIRDGARVVFVDIEEIDWIEACDYYVELHVGGKSYLHRESMNSLEARLDPQRFLRIHRSAIVNRRCVKELRHAGRRELICVLANGAELRVARSQREKLQHLL
jgi:two-component system, LytTR family, response regulator